MRWLDVYTSIRSSLPLINSIRGEPTRIIRANELLKSALNRAKTEHSVVSYFDAFERLYHFVTLGKLCNMTYDTIITHLANIGHESEFGLSPRENTTNKKYGAGLIQVTNDSFIENFCSRSDIVNNKYIDIIVTFKYLACRDNGSLMTNPNLTTSQWLTICNSGAVSEKEIKRRDSNRKAAKVIYQAIAIHW